MKDISQYTAVTATSTKDLQSRRSWINPIDPEVRQLALTGIKNPAGNPQGR